MINSQNLLPVPKLISLAIWTFPFLFNHAVIAMSCVDCVIDIQKGKAKIERENSTEESVIVGTQIKLGDLLYPQSDAVVHIRCANNTYAEAQSNPVGFSLGELCPDSVSKRNDTRDRGAEEFLALLQNRYVYATQILEAKPQLYWQPITRTNQYQVQVHQGIRGKNLIWETTTTETSILYDGSPLELGQYYQLIVYPLNQPNQLFYLRFRHLDQQEIEQLETKIAQINNVNLDQQAKAIALASIYQEVAQTNIKPPKGTGLRWQAINILEKTLAEKTSTPYLYRLVADLYFKVGLLSQAETAYLKSISLSDEQHQREIAASQIGLANIAATTQNLELAHSYLNKAKSNYELLKAKIEIDQVNELLKSLKKFKQTGKDSQ